MHDDVYQVACSPKPVAYVVCPERLARAFPTADGRMTKADMYPLT